MNKLAVFLTLSMLVSSSGVLLVHAIGEYGSYCGTIRGCLNLTVIVNSTSRSSTANWVIFSSDNISTNFYIQPAVLKTEGAANNTTIFNEKYNYTANSSTISRVIKLSDQQSVSVHYQASYYFTYFNKTLNSTVQASSANFNGSENYPTIAFNKTSGDLKPGENTSILTEATFPRSNNPLYNSLIVSNVINASIVVSIDPIAPVIQYIPEKGTIAANSNYTIKIIATLPDNFTLYHVWYSEYLATALPAQQNNTNGGAVIDVGTAKNIYLKGVTTSTIIPTTIAKISSNSTAKAAAQSGSAFGTSSILLIILIIIVILALVSYKVKRDKKRR